MPAASLLLPLLTLLGCDTTAPVHVVAEGDWWVGEMGELIDTCDQFEPENPRNVPDAWTISDSSAEGLTLQGLTELGDGSLVEWNAALDCLRVGNDFACTPFEETESGDQGDDSYLVTATWNVGGAFTSETTAEVVLAVELTCEDTNDGGFCGDIEESLDASFPCALEITQEIAAE